MDTDEKKDHELKSLLKIDDSFRKIVVVGDDIVPYTDDNGICHIGLFHFLLHPQMPGWGSPLLFVYCLRYYSTLMTPGSFPLMLMTNGAAIVSRKAYFPFPGLPTHLKTRPLECISISFLPG